MPQISVAQLFEDNRDKLRLAWVAQAALDGAIEVEQQAVGFGMLGICAIRQVERVDGGLQAKPLAELEVLVGAEIQREESVVLPQSVALDDIAVREDAIRN